MVKPKIGIIILLIISILCVVSVVYITRLRVDESSEDSSTHTYPEFTNVLVLGLDASNRLSDVILVVSVDRIQNRARFLSIPRDTRIYIEGRGYAKANAAYAYGQAQLAESIFGELLGIEFDGHIIVDMKGFEEIIDAVGGIVVDVDKPMKYTDVAGGLYIDIPAGTQRLSGAKALDYVRFRADAAADLGRIKRQQVFIRETVKALIAKPDKIPIAITALKNSTETDIDFRGAIPLAIDYLRSLILDKQDFMTLPGKSEYIDGVSYYLADEAEMRDLGFLFTAETSGKAASL